MQRLTAAPRDQLTADTVQALLRADALFVDCGLELLDGQDRTVADISADLAGGKVERSNYANIHGTATLTISRELTWGGARVRPYMTLGDGTTTARWNLGVYIVTTPETKIGETPQSWEATGYDKLYLLSQQIGDSFAVTAGSNVLTAVRAAITASGAGGAVLLDSTQAAATLPTDMVWAIGGTSETDVPTYLRVVNDLLDTIGYRGMWADPDGAFRSEPYLAPTSRPIDWAFTADDPHTSLVGVDRKRTQDLFDVPNWWRFIQRGTTTAPTEGAGQYTVINQSGGPNSIDTLGITKRSTVYLDAASQASLVTQGNRLAAALPTETLDVTTSPFPPVGHFDVYTYTDAALGHPATVQARSWSLPLNGADMTHVWEVL